MLSNKLKHFTACALLVAALFLAGCETLMETTMHKSYQSVAQTSYGAADMLIQQSRGVVTVGTPLSITALSDLDHPAEKTGFGTLVAQQLTSRFVQLGYNVTSADDTTPAANLTTVGGQYAVARDQVLVNLRLTDGSGKILAAYDYAVPKSPDVRELTKTAEDRKSFFDF